MLGKFNTFSKLLFLAHCMIGRIFKRQSQKNPVCKLCERSIENSSKQNKTNKREKKKKEKKKLPLENSEMYLPS